MPTFFVEAPKGVQPGAKAKMMADVTAALDAAYHIPDVRIFVREYAAGDTAQDGKAGAEPMRPVCFIEAPQIGSLDARRTLIAAIDAAVAEAYRGLANVDDILILHNEYPLEMAGAGGRLQSENPEIAGLVAAAG